MAYDELTPMQKMILPPLVYLEKHAPRSLYWRAATQVDSAGFFTHFEIYIVAQFKDLEVLRDEGYIGIRIENENLAEITLEPKAHLAVHEQFKLSDKMYVLHACYAAAKGEIEGSFWSSLAIRHANLGTEEYTYQFELLAAEQVVKGLQHVGGTFGVLSQISKVGVAMVERQKDKPQRSGSKISITNSPGGVVQHQTHHSNATVNQTGISGTELTSILDQIRSLPDLDANQKHEIEETMDDLAEVAKSPSPKHSRIKSAAARLSQLIPVGEATAGVIKQISAICKATGVAEHDLLALFHRHQ